MSTILRSYHDRFIPSKPVYKISLSGKSLRTSLIKKPQQNIDHNDPIQVMLNKNFIQQFNAKTTTLVVEYDTMMSSTMESIRERVKQFYVLNCGLKKPHQSTLYKWLTNCSINNDIVNDAFLIIYRYIASFCNTDMQVITLVGTNDHVNNVLEILELMRKKYE